MTHTDTSARGRTSPNGPRTVSWLDSSGSRTAAAPRRRRRVPHLVAGVLLLVLCVGGTVWWSTSSQDRVAVLATAHPVALGHVLAPVDLRSVDVSMGAGLPVVPEEQARTLLGRTMATSLGTGALLTPDSVGRAAMPTAGRAMVAVGVKSGQFPPEITTGASVSVVVTQGAPACSSATGEGVPAAGSAWSGSVVSISAPSGDQTTVVSLDLDAADANQLAQVPAGRLALVLQPVGAGR